MTLVGMLAREEGSGSGRTSWRAPARLAGKHGAERNLQVLYRRRAPHRAGHECRTSILPMRAFVYAAAAMPGMRRLFLAVCSYALVAEVR